MFLQRDYRPVPTYDKAFDSLATRRKLTKVVEMMLRRQGVGGHIRMLHNLHINYRKSAAKTSIPLITVPPPEKCY
jgi:hypothetical protein